MCSFDLCHISSTASDEYDRMHCYEITKETFVSQRIENEILNQIGDLTIVRGYLNEIKSRASSLGKPLIFTAEKTCGTAGVEPWKHSVKINFNCNKINRENIINVFIHELGEADYIINGFYKIIDTKDRERIGGMLTELLSHTFIKRRLNQLNLNSYAIPGGSESWLELNQEKDSMKEEEIILHLTWILISFPEQYERRNDNELYSRHQSNVDRLLGIMEKEGIFDNPSLNEEACKEIISFFNDLGLQQLIPFVAINDV